MWKLIKLSQQTPDFNFVLHLTQNAWYLLRTTHYTWNHNHNRSTLSEKSRLRFCDILLYLFVSFSCSFRQKICQKKECIPVGCIPPACYDTRGSPWQRPPSLDRDPLAETPLPGQRPPWTETPLDRNSPRTETTLDRDSPGQQRLPPGKRPRHPYGQTNTSENITFPQFRFTEDNNRLAPPQVGAPPSGKSRIRQVLYFRSNSFALKGQSDLLRLITSRKWSWRKVMFLHMPVILFRGVYTP